MAAKTDENLPQVVMDPETGELIEVNLDGAESASQADVREAKRLHQIEGPFAVLGVKILPGKSFDKEYAEFLYAQERGKVELAVTASGEIIDTFRRVQARGLATPSKPLLTKSTTTKTGQGYYVHKLQTLTAEEEAGLRKALSGK